LHLCIINHDWASGRLWNDQFETVYWIPLRELNEKELSFDNIDLFIAEVLSQLVLKGELKVERILDLIKQNRSKSLILLYGYDEATPHLKDIVNQSFHEKGVKILFTSRHDGTPLHAAAFGGPSLFLFTGCGTTGGSNRQCV